MIESVEKAVSEKRDYVVEFRIVLPEGTVKHIHGLDHPVFSASGELVKVVGTQPDVTELRRSEAALQIAYDEIKTLKDELCCNGHAQRIEDSSLVVRPTYSSSRSSVDRPGYA